MLILDVKMDKGQYKKVAGRFDVKRRRQISRGMKKVVRDAGYTLYSEVVSRSPKDTGAYAGAWTIDISSKWVTLTNESPQALRLEFGYVGIDSAGRHYAQAAQPHVRPSLAIAKEQLHNDALALLEEVMA